MNKNCINLIRLLAAVQVFLGHAVWHLEVEMPDHFLKIISVLQGVPVFFVISGFLIWNSLTKDPSWKSFVKKRILRLYPEMWGGIILSTLMILILYNKQIKWKSLIMWIITQSTVFQFWTPEWLRGYGCGTPNGSLWTIGVMVQAYVVIRILFKFLHGQKRFRWSVVLIFGCIFNIVTPYVGNILPELAYKLIKQTFIPYIWMFIVGALLCEFFWKIKSVLIQYWWLFLSVSVIATLVNQDFGIYGTIKVLFLAPALIGFAYRFNKLNIKYDISYGIYIYHMIVINVMIVFGLTGKTIELFVLEFSQNYPPKINLLSFIIHNF